MKQALIFANGEPNDGPMVRRSLAVAKAAHVIAADGGARVARYFNRKVHTLIGDMDSLAPEDLSAIEAEGAELFRYPAEKNETDLELCLQWAASMDYEWIRIIGGLGGRFDQALANVYLLALPQLERRDVRLVAGKQAIRLLRPNQECHIQGAAGDTISLLPVGGSVEGVRTENLQYPLRDEVLLFGPARGVSNVMLADEATVRARAGLLLVVHTIGKA